MEKKRDSKPRSDKQMEVGLTKTEVIARLGEPDSLQYIAISFRPPDDGEQKDDYQKALKQWENLTVGEMWTYDALVLNVRISKSGHVLDWSADRTKSRSATKSGLVRIDPETD